MAKKRFHISPKLNEDKKEIKPLPVQKISVSDIEKIATGEERVEAPVIKEEKKVVAQKAKKQNKKVVSKKASPQNAKSKKPQGRPRRTEPVKRLSSDLPADLYEQVKEEVRNNGYTLNGFLAKVLRNYFKDKKEA